MATAAATAAIMPAWANGETHRVDPRSEGKGEGVRGFTMGDAAYRITERGAAVTRDGVARPLPFAAFRGVAARAMEDADGTVTVTLELLHADEALSVPVLVARDLDDVAADWRAWAKRTGLPMLMVEGDGTVGTLDAAPRPATDAPHERRRRATRRPRFLVRRSVGLGLTMRIEGREMIRHA